MSRLMGGRGLVGVALLLISCGGGGGQSGAGGSGGGRGGSGGGGPTGGAGGGADCNAVTTACGGDVVGTWKVTQTCLSGVQDLSSVCAGASATLDYRLSGTTTYNANGTYSSSSTDGAVAHQHYPSGCMPFGYTCAQLEQMSLDAGTATTCSTDASGACNCDAVTAGTPTNATGTYSVSAGTLTTTHDGMTALASYCVQGSLLYQSFEQPLDGGATTIGLVVFAKQ